MGGIEQGPTVIVRLSKMQHGWSRIVITLTVETRKVIKISVNSVLTGEIVLFQFKSDGYLIFILFHFHSTSFTNATGNGKRAEFGKMAITITITITTKKKRIQTTSRLTSAQSTNPGTKKEHIWQKQ